MAFYKTLVKRAEIQVFDRLDSGRSRLGRRSNRNRSTAREETKTRNSMKMRSICSYCLQAATRARSITNWKRSTLSLARIALVRVDLVRELVPLSRAGVIFELSNALATRDLELALTLVRRLLDHGESAIGILLVAIVPTIRNLLLAKDLMERHRLAAHRIRRSSLSPPSTVCRQKQRNICRARKTARSTPTRWESPRSTRTSSRPTN